MLRPKSHRVLTAAPAHSEAAIAEWKAGTEHFIEWANLARAGDTSPAAVTADAVLTELTRGSSFGVVGVAQWVRAAITNIQNMVRDGHWHLVRCRWCDLWFLVKDARRTTCRRIDCVRTTKREQKAIQRQARRNLDAGKLAVAQQLLGKSGAGKLRRARS
jgi:hypothetical protein